MKTYTIELRADFIDETKHDALLQIVRENARQLLAAALLLKDKREPQIALQVGDMFERNEDLQILDDGSEASGGE